MNGEKVYDTFWLTMDGS